MTTESQQTIDSNAIAVTVEMGDDFTPGPRTAAALVALVEALHHEHGPETEGFGFEPPASIGSFAFVSAGADGTVAGLKWNDITLKKGYVAW